MSSKPNSIKRSQDEESIGSSQVSKVSKKAKKDKKKSMKDKSQKKGKECSEKNEIVDMTTSEKKKKKKSKKPVESVFQNTHEIIKEATSVPKKKKSKKAKSQKEKVEEKESIIKTDEPAVSDNAAWTDWSKTSFEDQARKDKFLRLMGAKKQESNSIKPQVVPRKGLFGSLTSSSFKPSVPLSSLGSASLSAESQKKISADLENQFEAAQRMKKNLQRGVKRGIGA